MLRAWLIASTMSEAGLSAKEATQLAHEGVSEKTLIGWGERVMSDMPAVNVRTLTARKPSPKTR
jgi:hypothetical protein